MSGDDQLIVHFDAPPVVEVIAGVALHGMGPQAAPLLAAFWKERLRDRFPIVEEQPAYSPPIEQFDAPVATTPSFEISSSFPGARLLVSEPARAELIQLQPGWFACNWRKVQPTAKYDHWPARQDAFNHWFGELLAYIADSGAPPPDVRQCEVTYVNHIYPNAVWATHADFAKVFTTTLASPSVGNLEQLTAQAQVALTGDDGLPKGRLHIKILPAFGRDGRTPLYVLELTARGASGSQTDFFSQGREAIVRTFVDITTLEMQEQWKKRGSNQP